MSRTVYRAPLALGVRGIGFGGIGLGVVVLGAVLISAADLAGAVSVVLWVSLAVAALVSVLVLLTGALRAAGWRTRLVFDESGFRNATGPGAGVRRASWKDVRKVQADGPVVSVDLAGGRQSVIRTTMLEVDPRELARELRSRLNQDRGYTPLGSANVEPTPSDGAGTSSERHGQPAEPDSGDGGSV